MTNEDKRWIDDATCYELLKRWRHAPIGDPILQEDTGEYYKRKLGEMRERIGDVQWSRLSKTVGW